MQRWGGRQSAWLWIAALSGLLLLLAALRPLALPDEGRYGEVGRWMLQSGDWLIPRLNGVPFFHKPPYLYWLEAISIAIFGASAWAVRLVPAAHAVLMLVTLYLGTRAVGGEALARRAALMLGTSLSFLIGGQYVNHDMLVASWIGVAIGCFALSMNRVDRPDATLARLGFVACAFGVLSKGLIGLALPGLVLLIWLVWSGLWRQILRLPWLSGLTLFGVLTIPWFVLAEIERPGMLGYLFGTQHFARYTATTFNNPRPWWFYLLCLVILLFPWIFFALHQGVRQLRRPASEDAHLRRWTVLAWIWVVAIVSFFSVPTSKLIGYVLPVMPPLAFLAALGLQALEARHTAWSKAFAAICVLAVMTAVGANIAAARYSERDGTAEIARALACQTQPADVIYVLDDFPYDLPFRLGAARPMVVVQDWPALRKSAGDNWRRELFEGADFDAQAARMLQTPDVLDAAARQPGNWVVADANREVPGFSPVVRSRRWSLLRSAPAGVSAAESPPVAQHPGLHGCGQQGSEKR